MPFVMPMNVLAGSASIRPTTARKNSKQTVTALFVAGADPKDKVAYAKGELVEPIKPIVYYLDPATPLKWHKYFKMGIEDWNTAFEKAGFKNAIGKGRQPKKKILILAEERYSTVR